MTPGAARTGVTALFVLATACGVYQEHYETAAQARVMGADQRGLPPFVPAAATNVHIVNDTNNHGVWIWCDLDLQAQAQLKGNVRAVSWSRARANTAPPPFSFNFPAWNAILGGTLTYTPPAGELYFVAGAVDEWHGIVDPSGRCWITLTSISKARSLARHMHRIPTLMGRMVMRRPGADA